MTEKESHGYWEPGILFTAGNHCAPWSPTQRVAYWDDYSPGQLVFIDLPHTGPVLLTVREPLNKYIWTIQDNQGKMYKINHLDFTYLLTLVHLGPESFFVAVFFSSYAFFILGSSGTGKFSLFVFQMLTDADPVAVPHMFPFSSCSIPGISVVSLVSLFQTGIFFRLTSVIAYADPITFTG